MLDREVGPLHDSASPPVGLRISVVVTAHARKAFLLDALRSLERQSLPRDSFEIFLLKDFEAPELGAELDRLRVQVVDRPPEPLGAWIAAILPGLRGEFVAFLDDDDAFEVDKLELAEAALRQHPRASFYHNRTKPWDEIPGPPPTAPPPREPSPSAAVHVIPPEEWKRRFPEIWRAAAAFNLSSMVVRRDLLAAFPEPLRRIEVSLSAFLFFAALRAGSTLLLDDRPLSRYRRGEGFTPGGAPKGRAARRLSELAGPRGRDAGTLLALLRPLELPGAEAPLRAAVAQADVVLALEGTEGTRRSVFRALVRMFRGRTIRALADERAVSRSAILFLLAPAIGRSAWARSRTAPSAPTRDPTAGPAGPRVR